MRNKLYLLIMIGVLLSSCHENEDTLVPSELSSHTQAIVNGTPATDEPYTVALFNMYSKDNSNILCNPEMDAEGIKLCQEYGPDYTCGFYADQLSCFQTCSHEGESHLLHLPRRSASPIPGHQS